MDKFRFLNWNVYKESKELLSIIFRTVRNLPKEYRFEIGNQIIRSSLSIVLNIADVLKDNKFINEKEFDEIYKKLTSISNQLGGFKKKLN